MIGLEIYFSNVVHKSSQYGIASQDILITVMIEIIWSLWNLLKASNMNALVWLERTTLQLGLGGQKSFQSYLEIRIRGRVGGYYMDDAMGSRWVFASSKATVIRATKTSNLSRNIAAKLVEKRCCAFYISDTTCLATKKSRGPFYFLKHAAATCNTFFLLRDKLCLGCKTRNIAFQLISQQCCETS